MKKLSLLLSSFIVFGCASTSGDRAPLTVVDSVDLGRYLGKWHEIASYPAWFAKDCTATTAEYTLLPDGKIQVVNRCREGRIDGPVKESRGKAEVIDPTTNAKLRVWFFWPFKGNYWIVDLDDQYQWAVVGEPTRKYLWILSRTPRMDEKVYQGIVSRLPGKGYDPTKLQRNQQITTPGGRL